MSIQEDKKMGKRRTNAFKIKSKLDDILTDKKYYKKLGGIQSPPIWKALDSMRRRK